MSVAQITGSGSGEIDQATYDSVIAGAAEADDATVQANAWATKIKDAGCSRPVDPRPARCSRC